MLSHKRGSKKCNFDWAALFSVHIHGGEMVTVIFMFLQLPFFIQQHRGFGCVTRLHRFAVPLVHFSVAQLDLQRPDHLAI